LPFDLHSCPPFLQVLQFDLPSPLSRRSFVSIAAPLLSLTLSPSTLPPSLGYGSISTGTIAYTSVFIGPTSLCAVPPYKFFFFLTLPSPPFLSTMSDYKSLDGSRAFAQVEEVIKFGSPLVSKAPSSDRDEFSPCTMFIFLPFL